MSTESFRLYVKCGNCGGVFDSKLQVRDDTKLSDSYFHCEFCQHPVRLHGRGEDIRKKWTGTSPPRNLRFSEVRLNANKSGAVGGSIKNRELLGPVTSFASNMLRLQAMVEAPVIAVFIARVSEKSMQQAVFERTGKVDIENADVPDEDADHLKARSVEIMNEWVKAREPEISDHVRRLGARGLEAMMTPGGPAFWLGLEATLISQITGTWTAFEVLAGDLWEAALNTHPHKLADLKGRAPKPGKPNERQEESRNKDEGKQIRISDLQRYGYDLSSRMGTVLRRKKNFTILGSIRDHYWEAFDDAKVCEHVEDKSIKFLAALRNVFVHRAGAVDQLALGELSSHPTLSTLGVDDRVPIDGMLVNETVNPVIDAAVKLILAVDGWLTDNPQQPNKGE